VHKMMIVDDSSLIRQKIERECDHSMFKIVSSAVNGADAITKYKDSSPEVVTMDLTMPNLDGIECIKGLIDINPSCRILVISALNDKETGIEALEVGAMGFITKPFSTGELQEALREIISD